MIPDFWFNEHGFKISFLPAGDIIETAQAFGLEERSTPDQAIQLTDSVVDDVTGVTLGKIHAKGLGWA